MKNLKRLLVLAKPYWGYLLVALIATLVATGCQLWAPMIIRNVISGIESGAIGQVLINITLQASLILLILYIGQSVCQYLRAYYAHVAAWNVVSHMRYLVYNHFQRLSLRYYHDKQTGQLMSRATNDTAALEVLIAHAIPDLIINLATVLGVMILLLTINPWLALVSFLVLPLIIVVAIWYAGKVRPIFRDGHQKLAEFNATVHDNLSGMKEIQLFNAQAQESDRIKTSSYRHVYAILKALRMGAVYNSAIELFSRMGMVVVIGVGGVLAAQGALQIADIVAFMLYLGMLTQPVAVLGRLNEDLQNAGAALERVFQVLEEEPDVQEKRHPVVLTHVRGEILLDHVTFSYNPGIDVLNDVLLHIPPGKLVALVGPTGVGKTTLISLICRMYDPTSGRVLIDGQNVKDVSLASLRDHISMVFQDIFLFNGSVAENIAFGKPDANFEDIVQAAKAARAHDFILALENGYDTVIGERGLRLSGGQKQRISIARAVLRNSPILILDEATASVDMETEKLIYEAMDELVRGRTTIVIAHRLASIKKADIIVVLNQGGVESIGTHESLMRNGGLYQTLYNIQFAEGI